MKINITVRPNSSRQEIQQNEDGTLKVYLKKAAVDGKANKELETLLKKHFKKKVTITKGHTSKNKQIEIE